MIYGGVTRGFNDAWHFFFSLFDFSLTRWFRAAKEEFLLLKSFPGERLLVVLRDVCADRVTTNALQRKIFLQSMDHRRAVE